MITDLSSVCVRSAFLPPVRKSNGVLVLVLVFDKSGGRGRSQAGCYFAESFRDDVRAGMVNTAPSINGTKLIRFASK